MTTFNSQIAYATARPVRTGVFAVVMVLALGIASGFAFGFDLPAKTFAQVIPTNVSAVTVFAPTPIAAPIAPPVFVPVVIPTPALPTLLSPVTVTANAPSNDASNGFPIGIGFGIGIDSTPLSEVVVNANTPADSDSRTPACCTDSTPATTVSAVIVPATVPADTDTRTPACCTDSTPGTTVSPVVVPATVPADTDTRTPACCGTPFTYTPPVAPPETLVITNVPPVVVPPPVVPPPVIIPPQPSCDAFSGTPTLINPGDAVTLAWKTSNATSITIDQGVGPVLPVDAGSVVVHPTVDTTYTATVANAVGNVTCKAPVKVTTTTVNPVPACVLLSADKSLINSGDAVTLTYQTKNALSASIDNGVGPVTPNDGTVVVRPTANTTYTLAVPGVAVTTACQATVKIATTTNPGCTENCGGGGCTTNCGGGGCYSNCGGGGSNQHVQLTKATNGTLASVSLSQIPYTGLDLGPIGTALYWTMLVLWSAAAAYLVLFGAFPFAFKRMKSFGSGVVVALAHEQSHTSHAASSDAHAGHDESHNDSHGHAKGPSLTTQILTDAGFIRSQKEQTVQKSVSAPAHASAHAPVHAPVAAAPAHDGFRSFASGPVLTIDDIVKGLSRESAPAPVAVAPAAPAHEEAPAHASTSVETSAKAHTEIAIVSPAQAAPVSEEVPAFIQALLSGDREVVFGTMRQLTQSGASSEDFMAQVICALDDAYRARIDGTPVHASIATVTNTLGTNFLERLVSSLTTAVDGSYSMGVTGIKLALTRALSVAQG